MVQRHRIFISYHHNNDEFYRNKFEKLFDDRSFISYSVDIGDIDPNLKTETIRRKIRDEYLRESSVTVVLVGEETWKRKHVDWEISSSLRNTQHNPRSGLLGIILSTYPRNKNNEYSPFTIPPRLSDNINCEFAIIYNWSDSPATIKNWIHEAYLRKRRIEPDNSRPLFKNNRQGARWSD